MSYYSLKRKNINTLSNFLIVAGIAMIILSFGPVIRDEIWFFLKELKAQDYRVSTDNPSKDSVKDSIFARYLSAKPILIEPVNKDFGIVIERLGVNAPVVADVSVANSEAYFTALKSGVAHASISGYPSKEPGNVYMFAHSSMDFWRMGKYATVFNLLRKLKTGDRIDVFYEGKDYIYETMTKELYTGWNTYPLTRAVIEPILTLQTCDPPGTTLNRLVVTAKLVDVIE